MSQYSFPWYVLYVLCIDIRSHQSVEMPTALAREFPPSPVFLDEDFSAQKVHPIDMQVGASFLGSHLRRPRGLAAADGRLIWVAFLSEYNYAAISISRCLLYTIYTLPTYEVYM